MNGRYGLTESPQLVFYGGSFDPPHQGHLDCIEGVLRFFPYSRLLMSPTPHPSGAFEKHKQPLADHEVRVALCEELRESAKPEIRTRFAVSRIEANLPKPNYTKASLQAVSERYDTSSLALVIGEDQFALFPGWKDPLAILELACLIVIPRESKTEASSEGKKRVIQHATRLCNDLSLDMEWSSPSYCGTLSREGNPFTKIFLVEIETSEASSTTIRDLYSKNEQLPKGWLPDPLEKKQRAVYSREIQS